MTLFAESLRAFLQPIAPFLDDPNISEVMINGPTDVWIEQGGRLYRTGAQFTEQGLLAAARNLAQYVGRPLTEERPRLDARLPDGSRVHVVLPPVARRGPAVSIRKFSSAMLSMDQLVTIGASTREAVRFIQAAVMCRKNIMVSGGTGSGKTTLLNCLSTFIPNEDRIITIEDSAELQLQQEHLVPLEARPADEKGRGEVTIRDLLHSSLRLRPDRIIIGEVRGGEAFDLLQAMNTGHAGSMTTIHANSPVESLSRLESLCLLAGFDLPLRAIRSQVAAAISLVVCTSRLQDGRRVWTHVTEVIPLDARGDYRARDLFIYTQTGRGEDGTVYGYLSPTGLVPTFQGYLFANGFTDMTAEFFSPATYGYPPPPYYSGQDAPAAVGGLQRSGTAPGVDNPAW
jgi:pilus assembly protein CpaF